MTRVEEESPIRPMGALKRFFIRLLLVALIVFGALAIAQGIVFVLGTGGQSS